MDFREICESVIVVAKDAGAYIRGRLNQIDVSHVQIKGKQNFVTEVDKGAEERIVKTLEALLPVVQEWFSLNKGEVIALIKPQFEAGRSQVARGGGVIRDPEIHRQVLLDVLTFAQNEGYGVRGLIRSPLVGPKGNVEFLAHLVYPSEGMADLKQMISDVVNVQE